MGEPEWRLCSSPSLPPSLPPSRDPAQVADESLNSACYNLRDPNRTEVLRSLSNIMNASLPPRSHFGGIPEQRLQ